MPYRSPKDLPMIDQLCTNWLSRLPPVAVPDLFLGFQKTSSAIDRCHSLSSLHLPPAALASLPTALCTHCQWRPAIKAKTAEKKMERYRAGMGSNDPCCIVHALSVATRYKSKNRRLPPAVHARRKEERKNEKLNLSNYIVPFKF